MRIQVIQKGLYRSDLREFPVAPKSPCSTSDDNKEGHHKHGGIRISYEERFRVGFVGEDSLDGIRCVISQMCATIYVFCVMISQEKGADTLPRKFEVVHSTTTTRSRMIPNVRRAIPSGIMPGPSGVVEAMAIGNYSCLREEVNLRDSSRCNAGQEPRVADVAIATFAAEDAELDGLSVGMLSSEARRARISSAGANECHETSCLKICG